MLVGGEFMKIILGKRAYVQYTNNTPNDSVRAYIVGEGVVVRMVVSRTDDEAAFATVTY